VSASTQNRPGARAAVPAGSGSPRPPDGLAGRLLGALGALVLLGSLLAQWAFDRRPEPDVALSAWELFARTDLALALLALVALAGAVLARRGGALVSAGAAALALLVVARQFLLSDPGRGGRLALLAGLLVLGGAALRVAPAPWRARGTELTRSALGRADALAGRIVASPVLLVAAGALIAWSTFPLTTLQPGGGTDGSWIAALHLAARLGLDFGTEIVFTYGPLGYLTVPRLFFPETATLGFLYVATVHLGLAITLLWAARRSFGLPVALVVVTATLALLREVSPDETTQIGVVSLVFALCVGALREPRVGLSRAWLPLVALGGAVAAAHALVKLNTGVLCGVLIALTALAAAPPGRRLVSGATFAGAFLVALLALWALLDQGFADLPAYLRRSFEVISGYAEYQYTEEEGRGWEYLAAAVVTCVLGATAFAASEGLDRVRRGVVLLLTAGYVFVWFKQGFVRHDGHSLAFFGAALTAGIALGWTVRPRAVAWAGVGVLLVALLAVLRPIPWEVHQPALVRQTVRDLVGQLRDPEPYMAAQREELRRAQGLDAETVALLRGRTTHIFPTEASVAWAQPELRWRPLPVFQGYQAYTDDLDDLNASLLAGRDAPERILRMEEFSPFENPGAVRELFCRYSEIATGEKWQVLARGPNRCGPVRSLGVARVTTEAMVEVPEAPPGEAVLVALRDFTPDPAERLRSLVWKPYDRSLRFDGEESRRVAVQLADEPSLLRVPGGADYSGPFGMDADVDEQVQVALSTPGVLGPARRVQEPVTVEFLAMPVSDQGRRG